MDNAEVIEINDDVQTVNVVTRSVRSHRLHTFHSQMRNSWMRSECLRLNNETEDALAKREMLKSKKNVLTKAVASAHQSYSNSATLLVNVSHATATVKSQIVTQKKDMAKMKIKFEKTLNLRKIKCSEIDKQWNEVPLYKFHKDLKYKRDNFVNERTARIASSKQTFVANCVTLAGMISNLKEIDLVIAENKEHKTNILKQEEEIAKLKAELAIRRAETAVEANENQPEEQALPSQSNFTPTVVTSAPPAVITHFPVYDFAEFEDEFTADENESAGMHDSFVADDYGDLECSVLSLEQSMDQSPTSVSNRPRATSTPLSADQLNEETPHAKRLRLDTLPEERTLQTVDASPPLSLTLTPSGGYENVFPEQQYNTSTRAEVADKMASQHQQWTEEGRPYNVQQQDASWRQASAQSPSLTPKTANREISVASSYSNNKNGCPTDQDMGVQEPAVSRSSPMLVAKTGQIYDSSTNPRNQSTGPVLGQDGVTALSIDVESAALVPANNDSLARYVRSPVSDDYSVDPVSSPPPVRVPINAGTAPTGLFDFGGGQQQDNSLFNSFFKLF